MTIRAGRYPSTELLAVRELTREDLKVLEKPRSKGKSLATIRESHHRMARLFAAGLGIKEVAAKTGYSENRTSQLHVDPAFQQLIAQYREMVTEAFVLQADAYFELATANMVAAERHINDHIAELDEAGELLPIKTALAVSRDAADRFGYGKKQTNLNVNVDFAAKLEKARRRSDRPRIVEAVTTPPLTSTGPAREASLPLPAARAPLPFRRRA